MKILIYTLCRLIVEKYQTEETNKYRRTFKHPKFITYSKGKNVLQTHLNFMSFKTCAYHTEKQKHKGNTNKC